MGDTRKFLFNPFDAVDSSTDSLNDLPPNLRVIVKKIIKKEPLTKAKGLEELTEWLLNCTIDEYNCFSEKFAKIYNNCVSDEERNIRELVNKCLLVICRRDKKWLAPTAKDLFYPWLISYEDLSSSISKIARESFDCCFGKDRYKDFCKIAWPVISQKAIRVLEEPTKIPYSLTQACQALFFVFENYDEIRPDELNKVILLIDSNIKEVENPLFHQIAYSTLLKSSVRYGIKLDDRDLFNVALKDLTSSAASEACLILDIICCDSNSSALLQMLPDTLPTEIPKAAIPFLDSILQRFDQSSVQSTLWSSIKKCKIYDSSRLLAIWKLLCQSLNLSFNPVFFEQAVLPSTIPSDIRFDVFEELWNINSAELQLAICRSLISDNVNILLSFAHDLGLEGCHTLNTALSKMTEDTLFLLLSKICKIGNTFDWTKIVIDNFVFAAKPETLLKCLSDYDSSGNNYIYLKDQIFGKVSSLSIDEQANFLCQGLEDVALCNFAPVSKELCVYAVDHLDPLKSIYFVNKYFDLPESSFFENPEVLHDLSNLLPYIQNRLAENDDLSDILKVFWILLSSQDNFHKTDVDHDLLCREILAVPSIIAVKLIPKLIENDFNLSLQLYHFWKEKNLETFAKMKDHERSKSIGLYSFPNLWTSSEFEGFLWQGDLSFIDIFYVLLLLNVRSVEKDCFIEDRYAFLSFLFCLEEENKYGGPSVNDKMSTSFQSQISSEQLFNNYSNDYRYLAGFEIVTATKVCKPIEFKDIMNSPNIIQYCQSISVWREEKLPCEINDGLWTAVTLGLIEFDREMIFHLLSYSPAVEQLATRYNCLLAFARLLEKSAILELKNPEFWNGYKPHLEKILEFCILFSASETAIIKHHVFLQFVAQGIISSILSLDEITLWSTIVNILRSPNLPILVPLARRFSLILSDRFAKKLNFVANDEILELLFSTSFESGKVALRSLIIQRIDDLLIKAKHELAALSTLEGNNKLSDESMQRIIIPSLCLRKSLDKFEPSNGLFALDFFLTFSEGAKEEAELFNAYCDYFRDVIIDPFLKNLVNILGWFSDQPIDLTKIEFTLIDFNQEIDLITFSANLLFRIFKIFPSIIRAWFSGLSKQESSLFLKYCSQYLSPLIIHRELVRIKNVDLNPLKCKVLQSSTLCSVQVDYHFEDFQMTFSLNIPPAYPLHPISVESGHRLGISESKWRTWLLIIQSLLGQNSSIINCVRHWKGNVEKLLEGYEPCSICYCVLQPGDKTLPGPSCKTCRNKFHSVCLYRWFKTSGNATCPMCRSLF